MSQKTDLLTELKTQRLVDAAKLYGDALLLTSSAPSAVAWAQKAPDLLGDGLIRTMAADLAALGIAPAQVGTQPGNVPVMPIPDAGLKVQWCQNLLPSFCDEVLACYARSAPAPVTSDGTMDALSSTEPEREGDLRAGVLLRYLLIMLKDLG